jgi:hypothetical protein
VALSVRRHSRRVLVAHLAGLLRLRGVARGFTFLGPARGFTFVGPARGFHFLGPARRGFTFLSRPTQFIRQRPSLSLALRL